MTNTASTSATTPISSATAPGPVLRVLPLGLPWETADPFLFCAHHDDAYPAANGRFGPQASLAGREPGSDFSRKDGWSMYHGERVPGFPAHPHRGFETITIVRRGLIDHADSLGASARFGQGDVQWLTAGKGIVHSEMFPLLDDAAPNPLELFQIWLNLPARSKMAEPHFKIIWSDEVPRLRVEDPAGRATEVFVTAGALAGAGEPVPPPPDSWAAHAEADVAVWTIWMEPNARWTLPPSIGEGSRRHLYFFKGTFATVAGQRLDGHSAIEVDLRAAIELINGDEIGEFLMLQGRPIGEPLAQYGPFVMNTQAEIQQTLADYRRTQFGGWKWPESSPVHGSNPAHFARHPDGSRDAPRG